MNLYLAFIFAFNFFVGNQALKLGQSKKKFLYLYLNVFFVSFVVFILDAKNLTPYIPLFIGISIYFTEFTKEKRHFEKNLKHTLILLDLTLIQMKQGRSFKDSLLKSAQKTFKKHTVKCLVKNNVVLQQPRSSFYKIFYDLEKDLNKVMQQQIHQKELLSAIKKKRFVQLGLHQKTLVSTSQYKAQSGMIFLFWLLALAFLYAQGKIFLFKGVLTLSFMLIFMGTWLSKKLLVKSEFQI